MLDDRASAELLAIFRAELEERCQELARCFLGLEKDPDELERGSLLDEAFRSAHSLKGAARSVADGAIEALAHGLEGLLGALKSGECAFTPDLFDLAYAVIDAMGTPQEEGAPTAGPGPVDELLPRLEVARLGSAHGDGRRAMESAPASADSASVPERAPSAAAVAPGSLPPISSSGDTIRLPVNRLDKLLEQIGELIVPGLEISEGLAELGTLRREVAEWRRECRKARQLVRQLEREGRPAELRPLERFLERNEALVSSLSATAAGLHGRLTGPAGQLGALTADLQDEAKQLRMQPFGSLTGSLERVVRSLTRGAGKEARLLVVGAETELDRRILEELKDPLIHLLRNAVDHGIEPPAERRERGKPSTGSVVITAAQQGGTIVVEVEDDGAGIDAAGIRQAALDRGLIPTADVAAASDADALRLIFLPGLSTRGDVDEVSGRGVGLDVVARNVERLGGRVGVDSQRGSGTHITLTLPLTLATMRALLVEVGGLTYALPTSAVERVVRVERLESIGGRLVVTWDGAAIPAAPLAGLLAWRNGSEPVAKDGCLLFAVVAVGAQRTALGIDRLRGEQEIVVKPLGYPLLRVRHFAGATILGSGKVIPILHPGDLVRGAASSSLPVTARPAEPERQRRRVLIAEDSLTTRTMERYILEAAGYDVELAGDGLAALAVLRERDCDVLVSDVNMPGLDGFGLTSKIREDARLRTLPVILVTGLESPEDRERGLRAGADAYIVKSAFDQDALLRTIEELV